MHQTKLSVAPMVAVTTPYHRFVCRLLSRHVTLYTEMVVAESLVFGKPSIVDGFLDAGASGPVVLQLAGRDSNHLCQAIQLAQKRGGFSSININCGCPSKKAAVGGAFGAQMMKEPELLNSIVLDILKVSSLPVTIKMRLGVDEFDSYEYVASFVLKLINSGVTHFIVHARKGILGLDTKKNRSVPPLKYEWVYRLCSDFPDASFEINGGINSLEVRNSCVSLCGAHAFQSQQPTTNRRLVPFGKPVIKLTDLCLDERFGGILCCCVKPMNSGFWTTTRAGLALEGKC
jgi:tRNA-dihydrouridine synthase A